MYCFVDIVYDNAEIDGETIKISFFQILTMHSSMAMKRRRNIMIKKIYKALDNVRLIGIISVFSFMITLSLVQIFLRYFSFLGFRLFAWGDEIIRLSSIWVVFLAASLGVKVGAHLSVAFFLEKYVPQKMIVVIQKIANILLAVVLIFLIFYGSKYTFNAFGKSLQNLEMSIAWFYAAMPVGCIYLLIDYLLIFFYGEHPFAIKKPTIQSDTKSSLKEIKEP